MTPTLSDTLRALAEAVPGRFEVNADAQGNQFFCVWQHDNGGHWLLIYVLSKHHEGGAAYGTRNLEYALREEIEARGWAYGTVYLPEEGTHTAMIRTWPGQEQPFQVEADSPAHALGLALLQALAALSQQDAPAGGK